MFGHVLNLLNKFSAPRSGETVHRRRTRFRGASKVRNSSMIYHHAKFGWVGISRAENVRCFLFVCFLSVTILNDKVCERHFAINALEFGNDLSRCIEECL